MRKMQIGKVKRFERLCTKDALEIHFEELSQ